jgi:hypothetical protein
VGIGIEALRVPFPHLLTVVFLVRDLLALPW